MKILTVADLIEATETTVALPVMSAALGTEVGVRVRKIGRAEYLAILPPLPPGSELWKVEEWPVKAEAWAATLTPKELEARQTLARDTLYRVAMVTCIAPRLTLEEARHLGDDAATIAAEVLRFSGLLKPAPTPEPAAEPEAKGAEYVGTELVAS